MWATAEQEWCWTTVVDWYISSGCEKKLKFTFKLNEKYKTRSSIFRKHYLWLSRFAKLRRTRSWPNWLIPYVSPSLMGLFSLITDRLRDWMASFLLTASFTGISAATLHAARLALSRTQAASELRGEFFTWGWQHQHSSSLLWPNDSLASRSELSLTGRPFWPLHIWVNAEKRLQDSKKKYRYW